MPSPPPRKPSRRRWAVLLLVLAAAGAGAYLALRPRVNLPDIGALPRVDTTGMTVQNIRQSSTRDGRTEWVLDAATARYLLAEKKILLTDMRVTFYPKEGGEVYLTARDGTVATDTQDMDARGDVVVWNEQHRLETTELTYRHATRVIASPTRSRITSATGEIAGDNLRVDLNTNELIMEGHVRGRTDPGAPSSK
jgi:LPS export ABC transporter protein LptC